MKRIFTLLFVCACFFSQAQNKFDVIFSEGFDGGALPAGWETHNLDGLAPSPNVGAITDAWTVLNRGGGDFAMYSTSWYVPAGISDDWVTTTGIDLSSVDANEYEVLSLTFSAFALNATFADGYEVYINTVGQELENFTPETMVFSIAAESTTETFRSIDLSDYIGETIYVAYRNNSNDKLALVVDNISVIGVSGVRAEANAATFRVYNEIGNVNVNVSGTNLSAAPADNVTVEYSVNGGAAEMATINTGGVGTLGALDIAIQIPVVDAGVKDIVATITQVNGQDLPETPSVSFTASVIADDNKAPRTSLIETFTASTCPPCLPGNENLHGLLDLIDPADKPVVIKFQQDFPGAGDGYATDESISRRGIYNINGIPNTNINGFDFDANTNALTAGDISAGDARSSFFDLEADYFVNPSTQTVFVKGSYTPRSEVVANTRLMIAIQENLTTNNISTNGETEFLDVFKKFVPGIDGIEVPAGSAVGEVVEFEYAYQFEGQYRDPADASVRINNDTEHSVEEFEDLAVSLWIESFDDNNVLNATNAIFNEAVAVEDIANINELTIYPNPVSTDLNLVIETTEAEYTTFNILDANGRQVRNLSSNNIETGKHNLTFNVSDLNSGAYYLMTSTKEGAIFTPFVKL